MRGPFDTENAITRQRSDISRAYTASPILSCWRCTKSRVSRSRESTRLPWALPKAI